MSDDKSWREIVASALDWDQAHITLDGSLEGLPAAGRSTRPAGYPHSVWMLLEHIRLAQHDLLDFCRNPDYSHDLKWPDDYWPKNPAPESDAAWQASIDQVKRDRTALAEFTINGVPDLTAAIPKGTGQTYLRTVLVAIDHCAYHLGQILDVRRLNGDWPA